MHRAIKRLPSLPHSGARALLGQSGFTLVEMVVAIVVGGILVSLTSMFVRGQIQAYFDVSSRAALADDADTATRRIAREIAGALPNSVRVHSSGCCLEFIPIRDAGRYRSETGTEGGNPLDFSTADNAFDVLGPQVNVVAGDELVIYNLGIPGADAYATGESRRGGLVSTIAAGIQTLTFTGAQFSLASPGSRFQVVSKPVSYVCSAGKITRYWDYGFNTTQLIPSSGTSALLAGNIESCSFNYTPAVLQRNGLVSIGLTLSLNDESVTLQHQVVVDNTP